MGKKHNKANKRKSKRGHVKSLVTRYRQKWVPIDEDGNEIGDTPLAPATPLVPSERKALAKAMLQHTGGTTAVEDSLQPEVKVRPDNVVSLCDRRAANSTEYTQDAQASINYDRQLFHQWSKRDKGSLYTNAKEPEALEWRRLLESAASHPKGRNPPPNVDEDVDHKKPISMVHNPGISSEPIESGGYMPKGMAKKKNGPVSWHNQKARQQLTGMAPSGRPISEFLEGGQYPPPKRQEQKSPEVRPLPVTPRAWAAEDQLFTMIDMVPEEHWPMSHIKQFLFQNEDGSWHVHTGQVRQAIRNQEDRIINRAVTLAFIEYGKDQEEHKAVLENEITRVSNERDLMEFELAHRVGDQETVDQMKHDWTPMGARQSVHEMALNKALEDQKYATVYAKPPEDMDKLVAEFKQFDSHVRFESPAHAYARMHYGDPKVADTVICEIEKRKQEAQQKEDQSRIDAREWVNWQKFLKQVPSLISMTNDRQRSVHVRPVSAGQKIAERKALRRIALRNTPAEFVQKAYLSGLVIHFTQHHSHKLKVLMNGKPITTDVIEHVCSIDIHPAKAPALGIKPEYNWMRSIRSINKTVGVQHPSRSNPRLWGGALQYMKYAPESDTTTSYEDWWEDNVAHAEVRYDQAVLKREESRQAEVDRLVAEHQAAIMNKPINKAISKGVRFLRTLKRIGDTDVYVSKKEKARRDEERRILNERTENEIREQNKLAEQERREQAEQDEMREQRRRERADRKARIAARRAEVKARKDAEKAAFEAALSDMEAEKRHKELARKLFTAVH